jgi:hypothetical protein
MSACARPPSWEARLCPLNGSRTIWSHLLPSVGSSNACTRLRHAAAGKIFHGEEAYGR